MATTNDEDTHRDNKSASDVEATPNRPVVSIRLSTIIATAGGLTVLALAVVLGVLWSNTRGDLVDRDARDADVSQAEQIATDYAVGASNIDYQDFLSWTDRLKANTTPELAAKFDSTAPKLRDLLTPLRWTSTATPITAKVMSENRGIYTVNVFLTVNSTSVQTPEGGMTTVVYEVVVNKDAGWNIADVGNTSVALPTK